MLTILLKNKNLTFKLKLQQASRTLQVEMDEEDIDGSTSSMMRAAPRPLAKLYRPPKSLFDLWQEYQFGKVYDVYGRGTSVTTILVMMVRDRKTGGNPNLWV